MRKISIEIHSNNMIAPETNASVVRSLVEFQVYTTLESQTKSLMISGSEDLEAAFPGCDVLSLPDDKVKIALGVYSFLVTEGRLIGIPGENFWYRYHIRDMGRTLCN